jgi:flagellar biosynthesis/type III secretory pathway M-ring protein FliF/YscJ
LLILHKSYYFHQVKGTSTSEKGDKVGTRYNKEYEQYYIYALEQFLINTYGYSEYDAKVKVMQDFDEVKEDFELKEIK